MKIRRRKVCALVGTKEASAILGVLKNNLNAIVGMPEPLQERGIEGFEVAATPLWPRAEIEELATKRREAHERLARAAAV